MDYGECKAGKRVSDERKMKGVCGEGQTREPEGRRLAPQLEERRQEALPKSERGLFRSAWSRAWESPYRRPRASGRRAPSPVLFLRPRISRQHPRLVRCAGSASSMCMSDRHPDPFPTPVRSVCSPPALNVGEQSGLVELFPRWQSTSQPTSHPAGRAPERALCRPWQWSGVGGAGKHGLATGHGKAIEKALHR